MKLYEFLYNLDTFTGKTNYQKKLYINMVLNPNQSDKELIQNVGCRPNSFPGIKAHLLERGLKIEPIDEIEEGLKSRISNIEKEQNSKIVAKDKIIIKMSDIYTQQPLELESFSPYSTYPLVKINYKNNPIVLQIKHGKLNIKMEENNNLNKEELKEFCNIEL